MVPRLPVPGGVDILASGEHESGDRIEDGRRGPAGGEWWYNKWYEPCVFEGGNVSGGQPDTTGSAILADTRRYCNCAG